MDQITSLIVDESKWLTASMVIAFIAVVILILRHRTSSLAEPRFVMAIMNLFFGVTILTMAVGHLLAVTTKFGLGTLRGPVLLLYTIGVALFVPSVLLVVHTKRILAADENHRRTTLLLHAWLATTLLVLGLHNLPLAAPALLNIAYQLHSRRVVGWTIVSVAVVVNIGLLIGSIVFFMSGQSFEEFSGIK